MTKLEYEIIQSELSDLIAPNRPKYRQLTERERDAYKAAVLACKSAISNIYTYRNDMK